MQESKDALQREIIEREKEIRSQLQKEFENSLQEKIKEHEEELRRKKKIIESEFQKRMKQVLE